MTNLEKVFPNKTQADDRTQHWDSMGGQEIKATLVDFKGKFFHSLVAVDGKIVRYVCV